MLHTQKFYVAVQPDLATLRNRQANGEALPQYIRWGRIPKAGDGMDVAKLLLHDNLLVLDLANGAITDEAWDLSSRRILDEIPL